MKTTALVVVVSFLILSGWALAAQKAEQKLDPSTMEHMMKEGDGSSRGGMMRMMKMMDQCATMMESAQAEPDQSMEKPKN
jgi:hypothetical protein